MIVMAETKEQYSATALNLMAFYAGTATVPSHFKLT
jgi:hypothetical protein